jgi:hypothetical protein
MASRNFGNECRDGPGHRVDPFNLSPLGDRDHRVGPEKFRRGRPHAGTSTVSRLIVAISTAIDFVMSILKKRCPKATYPSPPVMSERCDQRSGRAERIFDK